MQPRRVLLLGAMVLAGCAHAPPAARSAPPPVTIQVPAHPAAAADEEMQVSGTLGSLDEEQIATSFNAQMSTFSKCFAEAAEARAYLDGTVRLAVEVDAQGRATQVDVRASSLGNWAAERCIVNATRTLGFPRPHGGDRARFSYALAFHAAQGAVDVPGLAVLKPRLRRDIDVCSHKQPTDLTLWVAPGGKVVSFGAAGAALPDDFEACLTARVRGWHLSDPRGKIARTTVATTGAVE